MNDDEIEDIEYRIKYDTNRMASKSTPCDNIYCYNCQKVRETEMRYYASYRHIKWCCLLTLFIGLFSFLICLK